MSIYPTIFATTMHAHVIPSPFPRTCYHIPLGRESTATNNPILGWLCPREAAHCIAFSEHLVTDLHGLYRSADVKYLR